MKYVQAADSWLGLLIFLGAILFQLFSALRKGKTARPPVPGAPHSRMPAPVARRPLPVPEPAPWRPEPVAIPAPPREESAAPLPPRLRELFEELSDPKPEESLPAPAAPPVSEEPLLDAVRKMEAAALSASAPVGGLRLRLQNRAEWQRAIILSEVLQPPLALRMEALARSGHV